MTIWLTIAGMALVTLATRALPLLLLRAEPPPWLAQWLRFVPVAIFTALALRPLVVSAGPDPRLIAGAPLAAGLVGVLVAWRTSSVVLTIAAGLVAFWVLRFSAW